MANEQTTEKTTTTTGEGSQSSDQTSGDGGGAAEGSQGSEETGSSAEAGSISDALKQAAEAGSKESSEGSASEGSDASESGDEDGDSSGRPEGAPDTYDSFNRPDGFDMDDEQQGKFVELMKKGNASQELAQEVLDFVATHGLGMLSSMSEAQKAKYADHAKAELERAQQNPLLVGEEGDQWNQSMALVNKVVERFTGKGKEAEGTMAALKDGGFLDQEAFLVLMRQIGGAMTADTLSPEGDPAGGERWDSMTLDEKLGNALGPVEG